jgi:cell division protein FtsL
MADIIEELVSLGQRKGERLLVLLGHPKKSIIRRTVALYLASVLGVLFIAFWCVWQHIQVTSMGYEIVELQKKRMRLENIFTSLQIECASLKAPDRIEDIARNMGLKFPEKIDVVYLPYPEVTQNKNNIDDKPEVKWVRMLKEMSEIVAKRLLGEQEAEAYPGKY